MYLTRISVKHVLTAAAVGIGAVLGNRLLYADDPSQYFDELSPTTVIVRLLSHSTATGARRMLRTPISLSATLLLSPPVFFPLPLLPFSDSLSLSMTLSLSL